MVTRRVANQKILVLLLSLVCSGCFLLPDDQTSLCANGKRIVYDGEYPVLAREPFSMPGGFPLTKDATKVMLFADTKLFFSTEKSIEELNNYYSERMKSFGLTEATHLSTVNRDELNLVFFGWPNQKLLLIQAHDLAKSDRKDERTISVTTAYGMVADL